MLIGCKIREEINFQTISRNSIPLHSTSNLFHLLLFSTVQFGVLTLFQQLAY